MDRRSFLRTSAFAATGLAAGLGSRPATGEEGPGAVRRPNVVVIFADDLDFDEVGCFDPTAYPTYTGACMAGDAMPTGPSWGVYPERPLTPHMDSLKRDGALLDRFYMVCTVCTPSRYALLTGQHAGRSANIARLFPASEPACVEFNASIGLGQWTMPHAFRQAGYVTGAAGKWHTADWEAGGPGKVRPPICDAAGVEHGSQDPTEPENAARIRQAYDEGVLDGRSFLPALQGRPMEERPVLIEMGYGRAVVSDGWQYIAVRLPEPVVQEMKAKGVYSYVGVRSEPLREDDFPEAAAPDQLYDLREDLFEQRNLAGDRAYAEKLEEMKRKLADAVAKLPNAFGEFTSTRGDA